MKTKLECMVPVQKELSYEWKDGYQGDLNECDLEHIQKMISVGYTSGELCSLDKDGDTEHIGWWKI